MSTRLHLPVPLLLLTCLVGCAHSGHHREPRNSRSEREAGNQPRSGAIAIIPDQTKLGVGKVLADRCSLDPRTIYVLEGGWRAVPPRPVLRDERAVDVSLAPSGTLVAYSTGDGITVASVEGEIVATWEGARAHRWAREDDRLALIFSGGAQGSADSFVIWDPYRGESDTYFVPAEDIGWGTGDSLFVRYGDDVASVDVRTGFVRSSRHAGVDVSNDGLLSLARGRGIFWTLFLDEGHFNLTPRAAPLLGDVRVTQDGPAFWVRSEGDHHLLCVSMCGDRLEANGKRVWGCRTAIVDVLTEEVVASAAGYSIGPSADGRGAWIYDGYDVFPMRLGARHEPRNRRSVNLRITTRRRNPTTMEPGHTYVRTVSEGDLIPIPLEFWTELEDAFRLIRVEGSGRAWLTVPNRWIVNSPIRYLRPPELFEVTTDPVQLQPTGEEAGKSITVSVIP